MLDKAAAAPAGVREFMLLIEIVEAALAIDFAVLFDIGKNGARGAEPGKDWCGGVCNEERRDTGKAEMDDVGLFAVPPDTELAPVDGNNIYRSRGFKKQK